MKGRRCVSLHEYMLHLHRTGGTPFAIETRLRSILKKFFGRYHHSTLPYRVSVTTMANAICRPWYCCHEYVSFLETT